MHTDTPGIILGAGTAEEASHGNSLWSNGKGFGENKTRNIASSILNWLCNPEWDIFSLQALETSTEQITMLLRIKIICKIRGLDWMVLIVFLSSKIPWMPDHLPNGPKNTKAWGFLRMKEVLVPINCGNLVKPAINHSFLGLGIPKLYFSSERLLYTP